MCAILKYQNTPEQWGTKAGGGTNLIAALPRPAAKGATDFGDASAVDGDDVFHNINALLLYSKIYEKNLCQPRRTITPKKNIEQEQSRSFHLLLCHTYLPPSRTPHIAIRQSVCKYSQTDREISKQYLSELRIERN